MRLAAALVLVGCSGGIAFEDFADEQRDARCGYYVRCGAFASSGDCSSFFETFATDNKSLAAAVDAGKIRYDGDAATACIDAFDTLTCDTTKQTAESLAVCDAVFTGTGTEGSACAFSGECESERCAVPDCPDACCIGSCQPPRAAPGIDEPCTGICQDDLFCGADDLCHPLAAEGEACASFIPCAASLFCNESTGVCTLLPQRGEYCDVGCAFEGDVCSSDGVCIKGGVTDDPCVTAADCSPYYTCNIELAHCDLLYPSAGHQNGVMCTTGSECMSHYCDGVCSDPPLCY